LDFYNFCWVFQKFPFFCVTLYNQGNPLGVTEISRAVLKKKTSFEKHSAYQPALKNILYSEKDKDPSLNYVTLGQLHSQLISTHLQTTSKEKSMN
jgi:hypothetical protein